MNNGNKFFMELKENKDAQWVVDFLNKWQIAFNNILPSDIDFGAYVNDVINMEKLAFAAWKHYCEKKKE